MLEGATSRLKLPSQHWLDIIGRVKPGTDPKKLEALDVYPGRWSELNLRSDYDLGYYFGPFRGLQRVTERARAEQLGMIVWIS